ncbi:ACT domain containing protein, partial [Elaphomyces granulatus]
MAHPMSLISAQVHFMDERLALVHIPLDLYSFFLQPILQLLFSEVSAIDSQDTGNDAEHSSASVFQSPGFLNLSITPVECSIICSRQLAEQYFAPLVKKFNRIVPTASSRMSVSKDDFIVMQVDGQGLDAGQRVLELTSPLAMAGVSIFFISTYFSDYILVPSHSRDHVVRALEKRGFTFEVTSDAFVNNRHSQYNSFYSTSPRTPPSQNSPPNSPPPSTLSELQTRTFASLRRHNIVPRVDKSLRLVQCAAYHRSSSTDITSSSILRPALTTALIVDKPRFLSLTLTSADPAASILLEKRLLPRFSVDSIFDIGPGEESSLLLGSKEDILIPIMLDLRDLPLEATGIVCGVAGRLAEATHNDVRSASGAISPINGAQHSSFDTEANPSSISSSPVISSSSTPDIQVPKNGFSKSLHNLEPDPETYPDAVEIRFLSTARAGTVIVEERELDRAVEALYAESREPD